MGPAGTGRLAPDGVTELDDPGPVVPRPPGPRGDGPGGRLARWPDGAPAWLRGPGGTLLVALLAAALTAALVGRQAAARTEDAVAARATELALAVGSPQLLGVDAVNVGAGHLRAIVLLPVVNRHDRPLRVQVLGLTPDGLRLDGEAPRIEVAAGGSRPLRVVLDVDCAVVPEPSVRAQRPEDVAPVSVDVSVEAADDPRGPRRVRLPVPQGVGGLVEGLGRDCRSVLPPGG